MLLRNEIAIKEKKKHRWFVPLLDGRCRSKAVPAPGFFEQSWKASAPSACDVWIYWHPRSRRAHAALALLLDPSCSFMMRTTMMCPLIIHFSSFTKIFWPILDLFPGQKIKRGKNIELLFFILWFQFQFISENTKNQQKWLDGVHVFINPISRFSTISLWRNTSNFRFLWGNSTWYCQV